MGDVEYEAIITVDDEWVAGASGNDLEQVMLEGEHYLSMYAAEGGVTTLEIYEKKLISHRRQS